MNKKIGIINSGGDCPGLNTVIDAIVRSLHPEYEILGFYKGFEGLLSKKFIKLDPGVTSTHKFRGGTFLKSVNKGNFAAKTGMGTTKSVDPKVLKETIKNYNDLNLNGLIVLGGDGTMTIASELKQYGVNIVGVPKSIDNDLVGTEFTFGFQTSVEIATEALDRLETTAISHERVMILELMGRNAGWIGLYSGIAGGANVILIPEIPFQFEAIKKAVKERQSKGKMNTLIVVSEGATPKNGQKIIKKEGGKAAEILLGGVGEEIAKYLNQFEDIEARSTTLGHIQRGGKPSGIDRVLSRSLGSIAATMCKKNEYGKLVTYQQGNYSSINLEECIDEIKLVNPTGDLIKIAKDIGISFAEDENSKIT